MIEPGSPKLSPLARLLLWDYERGGFAYDILCVLMILWMCLPAAWWGDPMVGRDAGRSGWAAPGR